MAKLIVIERFLYTHQETIGSMICSEGEKEIHFITLEDVVRRKKIQDKTAIPFVTNAKVKTTFSPRFKRTLPFIFDVPDYTGIRIHSGLSHTHTSGCILLGLDYEYDNMTNHFKLISSGTAMRDFMKWLGDDEARLTIVNDHPGLGVLPWEGKEV